jgi:dolichyl-phosphate beta-glucosyltransferase
MRQPCTVVVPCLDEEHRLAPGALEALASAADATVLGVDDGSTDGTAALLEKIAAQHPERHRALVLGTNRGKGEAVRLGLLDATAAGAEVVAYCDADFATPPDEVARLVDRVRDDDSVDAVLGSRVALLGADIRRSMVRHYTGRVFATAGSLVLGVPVYDTQCGAKAFRVTDRLRAALATPFASRWLFDVELIGRLLGPPPHMAERIVEVPLRTWHESGSSRVSTAAGVRSAFDLVRIHRRLRRSRR